MEEITYKTTGTCSKAIHFAKDGDKITNIRFDGGCNGNLQAIARQRPRPLDRHDCQGNSRQTAWKLVRCKEHFMCGSACEGCNG